MTNLQVEYWKLSETTRTNKANENLRAGELSEATRHNKAVEQIEWARVGETRRHNIATEQLGWYNAQTERAYKEGQVSVAQANVLVNQRAVAVKEGELSLAQKQFSYQVGWKETELKQGWAKIDIERKNATTQRYRAETERKDLTRKWVDTGVNAVATIVTTGVNSWATIKKTKQSKNTTNYNMMQLISPFASFAFNKNYNGG